MNQRGKIYRVIIVLALMVTYTTKLITVAAYTDILVVIK